jgi:predicted nucleotidyltransferase
MPSVYSKVNKLIKERKLSVMGKGKYVSAPKAGLSYEITPWMKDVNDYLIATCIGINVCMTEKEGNLFVQVHKSALVKVESELKKRYSNVICKDDFSNFPLNLEGYIVIERLITESPVAIENGMIVPSMEKTIVDLICDKDGEAIDRLSFQKTVESRPFNLDSMMRYAARRGVKEEASAMVSSLDSSRLEMMAKVQKYLSTIPVRKAWVFGSFARGEETPASDLDLLVDYMVDAKLSLLDVIKYKLQLESIVGREVDLIENGYLKPFAIASAERDKYLIYER